MSVRDLAHPSLDEPNTLRRDRATVLVTLGLLIAMFAVAAAVQSVAVYRVRLHGDASTLGLTTSLLVRLAVNALTVTFVVVAAWLARVERLKTPGYVAIAVLVAMVAATVRMAGQIGFGVYASDRLDGVVADFVTAFVVVCAAFGLALAFLTVRKRERMLAEAAAAQRLAAASALTALQEEELRVRRDVADELHGTLQQRLVLAQVRADGVAEALRAVEPSSGVEEALGEVAELSRELDSIRESDVRRVSRQLYPVGLELGLAHAARLMMGRVPATIETHVRISEEVRRIDGAEHGSLDLARRLTVLRVLEEGISNALRHGHASILELELGVDDDEFVLVLEDDGCGLPCPAPELGGMAALSARLEADGGILRLDEGSVGGVRLVVRLSLRAASATLERV